MNGKYRRLHIFTSFSPACHAYFCDKLTALLNKPGRPHYVDEIRVGDLRFSDQPPLLSNIRWLPIATAEGNLRLVM